VGKNLQYIHVKQGRPERYLVEGGGGLKNVYALASFLGSRLKKVFRKEKIYPENVGEVDGFFPKIKRPKKFSKH
jgi:hypothetical protein